MIQSAAPDHRGGDSVPLGMEDTCKGGGQEVVCGEEAGLIGEIWAPENEEDWRMLRCLQHVWKQGLCTGGMNALWDASGLR